MLQKVTLSWVKAPKSLGESTSDVEEPRKISAIAWARGCHFKAE